MEGAALRQLMWSTIAVGAAITLLFLIRDHRKLRRYTFTFAAAGLALLMMPMLPFIGMNINGNRIWIHIGPLSFQPSEVAKILLTIFFASYLVQTRDALSLVGKRFLGFLRMREWRELHRQLKLLCGELGWSEEPEGQSVLPLLAAAPAGRPYYPAA